VFLAIVTEKQMAQVRAISCNSDEPICGDDMSVTATQG